MFLSMRNLPNIYQIEKAGRIEMAGAVATDAVIEEAIAKEVDSKIKDILLNCPQPGRDDIYKLVALQGHCLQLFGMRYLHMSENTRPDNKQFYIKYGMQLMAAAADQFKALLQDPKFDPENVKTP